MYTYVEQMPQLPGGGGNPAIVRAIQSKVRYPLTALRQNIQGRVFVSFLVKANGAVRNAKIVQGIGGGCDEEVLAVVRQLPNFTPGTQNGRPVTVGFTVPITFKIAAEVTTDSILHVYTLVVQMPQLPGGGGNAAIARTLQQALVVPADVPNQALPSKVFVNFMVGPSGVVHAIKVVRGLNAACDAAAVAAVQKLPRFVGGRLNGQPATVSITVPVLFGPAPPKP